MSPMLHAGAASKDISLQEPFVLVQSPGNILLLLEEQLKLVMCCTRQSCTLEHLRSGLLHQECLLPWGPAESLLCEYSCVPP